MSASPDFMTQILQQAGLLNSQPTPQGGLLGALNAQLAPYGGASGLGLSLMANRSGATAPGAALAQGAQDAQQLQLNNLQKRLQIAQMATQLPIMAFRAKTLNDLNNPPDASAQQSASGAAPQSDASTQTAPLAPPLIRNYDTPTQFAASQQTQSQPLASPYAQPIQFNGRQMSAQDYQRMLMAFGETPDVAQQKARAEQLAQAQMRIRPQLSVLDPIISSSTDPASIVQNNGLARQAWQLGAQQYGYTAADLADPVKVRQALAAGRNLLAASAELPAINAPERLTDETVNGVPGQRNPVTNKFEPQRVSEIDQYNFARNQGYKGTFEDWKRVNNAAVIASDQLNGPGGQLVSEMQRLGISFPGSRTPAAQAAYANNFMKRNPGLSPEDAAEQLRTGQLDFNGSRRSVAQLATQSAAANTAMLKLEKDFASLDPLVAKLPNAPAKINSILTSLKNNFSFGGDKDSAALVGWLKESAGEYAKLISGAYGAAGAGETNLKDAISQFQTAFTEGGYEGLKDVVTQSGQHRRDAAREGLQAASATGAGVGRGPTASSQSEPHPPAIQALLDKYK
jgi:hypothetical protein